MDKDMKTKPEKRQSVHYVNNKEFSSAVVDYVKKASEATTAGKEPPRISDYIGECFMKIAEGLSHKPSYIRYSFRDEMVMDAVENCVKAIANFDREKFEIRKAKVTKLFKDGLTAEELTVIGKENGSAIKSVTRWYGEWLAGKESVPQTGLPNAFAYFTQISYYAFLRRIAKENNQWNIKLKFIETASIEAFADFGMHDGEGDSLIARMRHRNDSVRNRDDSFITDESLSTVMVKKPVARGWGAKKKAKVSSSSVSLFMD
jgi:hypothetical protein